MAVKLERILEESRALPGEERLRLARLLLDTLVVDPNAARSDTRNWIALGLSHLQEDLDNEEDAIYDNWREHYHVPNG